MIKHIFSDMDGTLLKSDCTISENNVDAIKTSEIPLTLVSARSPKEMIEVIDKLDLFEPQIAFNGALIFKKVGSALQTLQADTLNLDDVRSIVDLVTHDFPQISCSFYTNNDWFVEKIDSAIQEEMDLGGQVPTMVDFVSLLKQTDLKVYKIMLITFDLQEMAALVSKLKQSAHSDLTINQSTETYLEITSSSADKARGVKYIQNLEGLQKSEMAAFGDGHNDISMLQEVGTPIVMANDLAGVKEHGKYLTRSNDEDGVAYGIDKFLK